jgi:hypothetical protein
MGWTWNQDHVESTYAASVMISMPSSAIQSLYIRNNVFYETQSLLLNMGSSVCQNLVSDYNAFYTSQRSVVGAGATVYTMQTFGAYQATGRDTHSFAAPVGMVDPDNGNYHLLPNSRAVNYGCVPLIDIPWTTLTVESDPDYNGIARPRGDGYDMGAYEYDYLPNQMGLVANWKLNETTSGNGAVDSYGGHNGSNAGVTVNLPSVINTAYGFSDSVAAYVTVPTMNYDELSWSGWFYRSAIGSSGADGLFNAYGSDSQGAIGYRLKFDPSSNRLDFDLVTSNGSPGAPRTNGWCSYDFRTEIQKWHHVAATYNKTTGAQTLYVDGVAVSTSKHTAGNTIVPYSGTTALGYSPATGWGEFNGQIDDVKLFNRPLTPSEADEEYRRGSLAAHWALDAVVGTTAYDSGCNGNNGAAVNMTAVEGQIRNAYSFTDSVAAYVTVPTLNYDEFTWSGWFYRTTIGNPGSDGLFNAYTDSGDVQARAGYRLKFDPNCNRLDFDLITRNGSGYKTWGWCSYDFGTETQRWHSVAATYNKTTGVQTLYIDGVAVSTCQHTAGNTVVSYAGTTTLGYEPVAGWGIFNGRIDDVSVYSRPLTPEQVDRDYQNGITAGYWKLDEKPGIAFTFYHDVPPLTPQAASYAVYDTSYHNLNGSNTGTAGVSNTLVQIGQAGQIGTSYGFSDSIANWVPVPTLNNTEFTWSGWFCHTAIDGNGTDALYSAYDPSAHTGYWLGFNNSSSNLTFNLYTTNGTTTTPLSCSVAVNTNQWYYVTATYDKSSGTQRLYINGVPAALCPTTTPGYTVAPYAGASYIGYSTVTAWGEFNGRIDDVRIFSRPLSADQVLRNYAQGRPFSTLINVDMNNGTTTPSPTLSGQAMLGGCTWNGVSVPPGGGAVSVSGLKDSNGTTTGVSLSSSATMWGWDNATGGNGPANALMRDYAFTNGNTNFTITLSGLTPSAKYELIVYAAGDATGQGATISGAISGSTTGNQRRWYDLGTNCVVGIATANSSGVLTFTVAHSGSSTTMLNGLQIGQISTTGGGGMGMMAIGASTTASTTATSSTLASSTLASVTVNDGAAQRSSVTGLGLTFNDDVVLDPDAFTVTRKDNGATVAMALSSVLQNGKTIVTLGFGGAQTEKGSLKDGEYLLTVDGSKVRDRASGALFDGDGDGLPGGIYRFGAAATDKFFRKFGDADGDRDVDAADLLAFRQASAGSYKWYFDADGDGDVDATDLLRFKQRYA